MIRIVIARGDEVERLLDVDAYRAFVATRNRSEPPGAEAGVQ